MKSLTKKAIRSLRWFLQDTANLFRRTIGNVDYGLWQWLLGSPRIPDMVLHRVASFWCVREQFCIKTRLAIRHPNVSQETLLHILAAAPRFAYDIADSPRTEFSTLCAILDAPNLNSPAYMCAIKNILRIHKIYAAYPSQTPLVPFLAEVDKAISRYTKHPLSLVREEIATLETLCEADFYTLSKDTNAGVVLKLLLNPQLPFEICKTLTRHDNERIKGIADQTVKEWLIHQAVVLFETAIPSNSISLIPKETLCTVAQNTTKETHFEYLFSSGVYLKQSVLSALLRNPSTPEWLLEYITILLFDTDVFVGRSYINVLGYERSLHLEYSLVRHPKLSARLLDYIATYAPYRHSEIIEHNNVSKETLQKLAKSKDYRIADLASRRLRTYPYNPNKVY